MEALFPSPPAVSLHIVGAVAKKSMGMKTGVPHKRLLKIRVQDLPCFSENSRRLDRFGKANYMAKSRYKQYQRILGQDKRRGFLMTTNLIRLVREPGWFSASLWLLRYEGSWKEGETGKS
jgi:hypothetical protein